MFKLALLVLTSCLPLFAQSGGRISGTAKVCVLSAHTGYVYNSQGLSTNPDQSVDSSCSFSCDGAAVVSLDLVPVVLHSIRSEQRNSACLQPFLQLGFAISDRKIITLGTQRSWGGDHSEFILTK